MQDRRNLLRAAEELARRTRQHDPRALTPLTRCKIWQVCATAAELAGRSTFSSHPHLATFDEDGQYCFATTLSHGCRAPFVGCVGAFGILVNEEGGLISGNFADFFALLKWQIADHPHESPLLSDLIKACAYSGTVRIKRKRRQPICSA
jgi:hypothetical protein